MTSAGRSAPRKLLWPGVVAVCAVAWVAACGAEPQQVRPTTQSSPAKPLVAQFLDDAEAIDPVPVGAVQETSVSVAARRFQTRCVGTGEPAVILVSGANVPQATWHRVQAKVAARSRVCTYDRLGIGDSGPIPDRQTLEQLAGDLDELIGALMLPRPVVVVGHSMGGEIAMVWAASHPTDTAGIVLIDATPAAYERELAEQAREHYPTDAQLNAPAENVETSSALAQLDALPRLDAVPLVVLTHTLSKPDPNYPQIDWNALERAWMEGQRHWATYSRVSEMVLVENAGHFIHLDQLNTVVAAVLRML